ncbi:MAG TPA: LLM class flavin-dependent oxidoreductase, partial [Archaeoglobus sp.]|nr:LLM class flavin-dependent oxidoreductase [Archaeoglobus sp.]
MEEKEELGGFRNLKSRNFSIGEVGVNLNGDLADRELVQRARIIQKKGIRVIWVGEFEGFRDPFEVAEILASETKLVIGFGILSPSRRECKFIRESYCELIEKYGDRFILGLGAGNLKDRDLAYKLLVKCVKELEDLSALVGCSSPKVVRFSSLNSAGILYNSVDPTIIEWLKKFELRKIFSAAYGPALILPSQYYEDLLLAASII